MEESTKSTISSDNFSCDSMDFIVSFIKEKSNAIDIQLQDNEIKTIQAFPPSPKISYNKNSFCKLSEISIFCLD